MLDGSIATGRLQRAAVDRHLHDLAHAQERGYHFDESRAIRALELFEAVCTHTKAEWAGKQFTLSGNQCFIVWCLWGWRDADGLRRFRFAFISCARKWGKSEVITGLALLATAFDDPLESGAEVYCVATKEDQAKIVHNIAKQMIRQSPILQTQLSILAKSIVTKDDAMQPNSFFKPLGQDSKTSDGFNLHFCVFDEIHEWTEHHNALHDKLTTAHGARRQALMVYITTAGDDTSKLWQELDDLACMALEHYAEANPPGDNRFAFIARMDEARTCHCGGKVGCESCRGTGEIPGDDIFDERNWIKANPNYPITPKRKYLEEQFALAKESAPALNTVKRYTCNMKVTSRLKAIDHEAWLNCTGELSDWSDADVVAGAWDCGGQDDLSSLGLCARFDTGERNATDDIVYRFEVMHKSFINIGGKRDLAKYPWCDWVASGLLVPSLMDTEALKEEVKKTWAELNVLSYSYDPAMAKDMAQALEIEGIQVQKFQQSAAMWTEPTVTFIKHVKQQRIKHNGDGLLSWAVDNLIVFNASRGNADLCMPDKRTSKDKIDPIVSVIMAHRTACIAPERVRGSLYIT